MRITMPKITVIKRALYVGVDLDVSHYKLIDVRPTDFDFKFKLNPQAQHESFKAIPRTVLNEAIEAGQKSADELTRQRSQFN